jgi:hypothetical protein
MDNKVLVIGGIAVAGLLLLSKKRVASNGGTQTTSTIGNATVITNQDGSVTAKVGNVITNSNGTVTDKSGNAIETRTMTDSQRADLIAALNAQNAAVAAIPPDQWQPLAPSVNGIPSDLYATYLANKDLYAQFGKPPPIQYDNTVPGVVTAIPYNDPSKAVTYADPDGTLTFTNANGTPIPNDPAAVVVNAAPVSQPAPVQSSPVTSTYTQSQYDADMALLAKNAPSLLTPDELAKYGGGSTPAVPAPVVADIFTGGLNTDAPYQIINGVLYYV